MNRLEEYIKKNKWRAYMPIIIESDGKEYLQFSDSHGLLMNREELRVIIEELSKTLELDNSLDNFIEENNAYNYLSSIEVYNKYNDNMFAIPFDRLRVRRKEFNPSKRKWSFKCSNCSTKVSSTDENEYVSIVPGFPFESKSERVCSIGCAKVVAKDIVLEWFAEQEYPNMFYVENLSQQLEEYLKPV